MAARMGPGSAAPILSVRPGPGYAARMRIALLLAGILLSLAAQPQEIYRWVDKDGVVHYADQPGAPDAKLVGQKIRCPFDTTVDIDIFFLDFAVTNELHQIFQHILKINRLLIH